MRIAQAVLAQVLSGAREDDDAGAACVEPRRGALGERHRLRDGARAAAACCSQLRPAWAAPPARRRAIERAADAPGGRVTSRRSSRDPLVVEQRRPISFGTKAIAWPAADSTQPVLSAVHGDDRAGGDRGAGDAAADQAHAGLRAVGGALEHPDRRRSLVASTATTVSAAPAESTATGAATETAIGRLDKVLRSDSVVDCARALVARLSDTAMASARRRGRYRTRFVGMEVLRQRGWRATSSSRAGARPTIVRKGVAGAGTASSLGRYRFAILRPRPHDHEHDPRPCRRAEERAARRRLSPTPISPTRSACRSRASSASSPRPTCRCRASTRSCAC